MQAPEAFSLSLLSLQLSISLSPSKFPFYTNCDVMECRTLSCSAAKFHISQYHRNPTGTLIVIYLSYFNHLCELPCMQRYFIPTTFVLDWSELVIALKVTKVTINPDFCLSLVYLDRRKKSKLSLSLSLK